jgi:hypothetical protein
MFVFSKKLENWLFSPGIFVSSTKLEDWLFSPGIFVSTKLEDWWFLSGIFFPLPNQEIGGVHLVFLFPL